jgi:hypothetical protein
MTAAINNFAHKTSFRLDVPDGGKTRSFQLNVQETSIPGMNIETATVALSQQLKGSISGTGVTFDPLSVRIILDEDMNAYTEIFEWMMSTVNFHGRQVSTKSKYMPPFILLHVIDNSKRKIVCTFKYHDPYPFSMAPLDFSYVEDGNPAIQCDVQFNYKWFDIEKDGAIISARPNVSTDSSTKNSFGMQNSTKIGLHPLMK